MSSKKKKHPVRSSDLHREEKLRKAAYFRQIDRLLEAIGARDALKYIPEREKERLYLFRFRDHKVKYAGSVPGLPAKPIEVVQKILDDYMHSTQFSFPGSDLKFSYAEYFSLALTLEFWADSLNEKYVPQKQNLLATLQPLIDFNTDKENIVETGFDQLLEMLGATFSAHPYRVMTYFTIESEIRSKPRPFNRYVVRLNAVRAEVKVVKYPGYKRTFYAYISTSKGPIFPKIKAGLIVPDSPTSEMEVALYTQPHVFDRLRERVDCFDAPVLKLLMDTSILEPETCVLSEGHALLTFSVFGYKLGYFVVELVDGVAVIKTFLFLTNDGTPEGKRLQKNLGLSKLDKAYICLDKLSTFVHSDLRNDPLICGILKESGCDLLLHIDPKVLEVGIRKAASIDAEHIRKYLALGEQMADEDQ